MTELSAILGLTPTAIILISLLGMTLGALLEYAHNCHQMALIVKISELVNNDDFRYDCHGYSADELKNLFTKEST